MTDEEEETIGYVAACPDCGAVGSPEPEHVAESLAELHNDRKGHSATVSPATEDDEELRKEAMGHA